MRGFAAFVMRGPAHAGAIAGAGLLAGFVLPPFAWISAGVVALVVLRVGAAALVRMAAPALIGVVLAGAIIWGQPGAVALAGLSAWLPVIAIAGVFRRRMRLDDALLGSCVLGWLAVVAIHLALADPAAAWQRALTELLSNGLAADRAAVADLIERLAPWMTGLIATSVVFSTITSVLLARWWQSLLDKPGAFGREFRALRLGRVAAGVTAALALAAGLTALRPLDGFALVAAAVFVFQGLAVAHGVVAQRSMSAGWLVGLYVLGAILLPQMLVGLAVAGVADAWMDFRGRAAADS